MSALCAALVLSLAGAPDFILDAAARTETRGGLIPYAAGQPGSAAIDIELQPQATLVLQHDDGRLSLGYAPRLLRRFINPPDNSTVLPSIDRFLVLHTVEGGYRHILNRAWAASLNGGWARGESDYGALAQGPAESGGTGGSGGDASGASSTGSAAVLALSNLSGSVGVEGALDRTQHLIFGAHVSEIRSVGDQVGALRLPRSLTIGGAADYELALSRNDRLRFGAAFDVVSFDALDTTPATQFRNGALRAGFEHAFSRTASLGGRGGLILINSAQFGTQLQPVGEGSFSFSPWESRNVRSLASLSAGIDGFANPLLGNFQTRLNLGAGLSVTIPPDWTVGLTGAFVTPLDEAGAVTTALDSALLGQTLLSVTLPIGHRINETFQVEFGGRFSALAPRLSDDNFRLGSINLIGYLALMAAVESVL